MITRVVAQVTNKVFVSAPLCKYLGSTYSHRVQIHHFTGRNDEWLNLNLDYVGTAVKSAAFMSQFPRFVQP
jgi:hypothetical protein